LARPENKTIRSPSPVVLIRTRTAGQRWRIASIAFTPEGLARAHLSFWTRWLITDTPAPTARRPPVQQWENGGRTAVSAVRVV
jgi:hypothetical protein